MSASKLIQRPVLFIGGHHNSALVVALELRKKGIPVVWVGHKFTIRGDKSLSAEYQEVTSHQIPFYEFKTGKFYRKKNPLEFLKILTGFFQALTYLLKIRPCLIVSFGGYMAVPVVIVGWLLRIKSVTHEQTVTAGYANKAVTPFVKKIFLTHQSSRSNYPSQKAIVTGLPIPSDFLKDKPLPSKLKTIFITCGKQGSHIINQAVFPLIPRLVEKFKVVHQTGSHTITADQDKARRLRASLTPQKRKRYLNQPYFFGKQGRKYLHRADLIISRAGAHTVYELIILNKLNIVIPIPWVSHNEQMENAKILALHTTTTILNEADLTPVTLQAAIDNILKLKPKTRKSIPVITDATHRILKELEPYLK